MGRKKKKFLSSFGLHSYTDPKLMKVLESWPDIDPTISQQITLTAVAWNPKILASKEDKYGDKEVFELLIAEHIDFVLDALIQLRKSLDPEKMSMRDLVTLYLRTHPESCGMIDGEIVWELQKNYGKYGITFTPDTVKKQRQYLANSDKEVMMKALEEAKGFRG